MHGKGDWLIPKIIPTDKKLIEKVNYSGDLIQGRAQGSGFEQWPSGGHYDGAFF